jgi:hypothetical protein
MPGRKRRERFVVELLVTGLDNRCGSSTYLDNRHARQDTMPTDRLIAALPRRHIRVDASLRLEMPWSA